MKILFLDIDGVLLPQFKNDGHFLYDDQMLERFPKNCINALNHILTETNCEIVISSDWRRYFNLSKLIDIFKINGIIKSPIDVTDIEPTTDNLNYNINNLIIDRVKEINRYVSKYNPEKWVAVDDLDLNELDNFVICKKSSTEGISQLGVKERIIKKLI